LSIKRPGKQYIARDEALERIRKYCAYQERCHQEVWAKLEALNQDRNTAAELVTQLVEEDFLNEERFALAFVKGKFNNNQWGRLKIREGLKAKAIHPKLIDMAMQAIEEATYREHLWQLMEKKLKTLKARNQYDKKARLARYLIGKGYEQDLVWELIGEKWG